MYLRGMRGLGLMIYNDATGQWEDDGGMVTTPGSSDTWPTGNTDWTGLLKTAMDAWGIQQKGDIAKAQIQGQVDIARVQSQNPYASLLNPYGSSPLPLVNSGYSPFPASYYGSGGTLMGMSYTTWALIALGVAAAYYAAQK